MIYKFPVNVMGLLAQIVNRCYNTHETMPNEKLFQQKYICNHRSKNMGPPSSYSDLDSLIRR